MAARSGARGEWRHTFNLEPSAGCGGHSNVVVAGVAGLVAGAMAMAAGEYVSVHSQADTEQADLALERAELGADDVGDTRS